MEKEIRRYENLYVSIDGKIFDCSMNEIIPHDINGYNEVSYKSSVYKSHILVAKCFPEICGEWFDGCHVHHKDRDRKNNNAYNLAVLTPRQHALEHSNDPKQSHCRKIGKYDPAFNLIKIYESYKEVLANETISETSLRKVAHETKMYKGYYYIYID